MSRISWLHLSDWHQKGTDLDRELVRDRLVDAIRQRAEIDPSLERIDFVVFSGDLAFSGAEGEYRTAFDELLVPILEVLGLEPDRSTLMIVPGNHDFERQRLDDVPEKLKKLAKREEINEALRQREKRSDLLRPFGNFDKLVRDRIGGADGEAAPPSAGWTQRVQKDGVRIAVALLNSSWRCARLVTPDGDFLDYGQLAVGEGPVVSAFEEAAGADVVIGVLHHPLSWLAEFDRILVEEHLTRHCHFILHGHEHLPRVRVTGGTEDETVVVPGGACYDRRYQNDPRFVNAFNFVHVDVARNEGTVHLRRWSDPQHRWVADESVVAGGIVNFSIPRKGGRGDPVARHARRRLVRRFSPALERRFCDEVSLRMRQTLQVHGGHRLVKNQIVYRVSVVAGPEDSFGLVTFRDGRVQKLIATEQLNIQDYELRHFKVNGNAVEPTMPSETRVRFDARLGPEPSSIDYSYVLYMWPYESYVFTLKRFAHAFRFTFEEDAGLRYNFLPLGGLEEPVLREADPFRQKEAYIDELCFPDQGYLIQWHPADDHVPPAPL